VLVLVVLSEAFVRREDLARDGKIVCRGIERPEVDAENHDSKGNICTSAVARLLGTFSELIGKILA